jgi:serine/threonine protein kinase
MLFREPQGLAPGTVLGEVYRVGRRLAEGGMGAVYEAQHLRTGRRCAVKVLAPELAASAEALTRFHREVEITAKLAHPHVVQVFDVGQLASGQPYLVMEYLEGEDLARRLRRVGRMTLLDAVHIAKQIASALAGTHTKGIVHRDLKPANIFLLDVAGSPDFVKVVDFGISKMPRSADKLTRASVLIGTPEYMAPEQASGKSDDLDHRTDQWALAVIVWEMISGRPPFAAAELSALLFAIVHEAPAPLHGGAAGPAVTAVESVLLRALEKRQSDRFATVSAFVRSLESAAVTSVATTSPAPARGGGGSTAPAQPAVASPVARIADKGTRWLRPTRWAALDPALVLKTLHIRRTRDDALPRRRWWWLLVVLPALAAAAFWTLTTRLPGAGVAPDRASAIGAPVPAATIKAARPVRHR